MILGIAIGAVATLLLCALVLSVGGGSAIGDLRDDKLWLERENKLLRLKLAERSQRGEVS